MAGKTRIQPGNPFAFPYAHARLSCGKTMFFQPFPPPLASDERITESGGNCLPGLWDGIARPLMSRLPDNPRSIYRDRPALSMGAHDFCSLGLFVYYGAIPPRCRGNLPLQFLAFHLRLDVSPANWPAVRPPGLSVIRSPPARAPGSRVLPTVAAPIPGQSPCRDRTGRTVMVGDIELANDAMLRVTLTRRIRPPPKTPGRSPFPGIG